MRRIPKNNFYFKNFFSSEIIQKSRLTRIPSAVKYEANDTSIGSSMLKAERTFIISGKQIASENVTLPSLAMVV